MKLFQRIGALTMAAAMTFSLAACGSKEKGEDKDAAAVVAAATEKAAAVKSVSTKMLTEIGMKMGGESVNMTMNMDMSMFADPLKAHITMEMTADQNGGQPMEVEVYMEQAGENYNMYMFDGSQWVATTATESEMGQFDPNASADLYTYANCAKNFTAAGKEKVGDVEADRYDGTITGKDIDTVLEGNESMQSFKDMMGTTNFEQMGDIEGLKVSIWIDPASGYPVRCQLDMSAFMTDVLTKGAKEAGMTGDLGLEVGKALVTVDYSDFDTVEDFEIPAEAKAA